MDSPPFDSAQSDFFALQPLLEGLAHLHEWVAISNRDGRTLWTSDGQLANDVLAGRRQGPWLSEVLPIQEGQGQRGELQEDLARIHRELETGSESGSRIVNIGRGLSADGPEMRLQIFRTSVSPGKTLIVSVVDPAAPVSAGSHIKRVEELEVKNAALENDLHGMAHSLRSSLVPLLGFSRLLKDDYSNTIGAEGAHFIQRIEEAGTALSEKIDKGLQVSQIKVEPGDRTLIDPRRTLMQIQSQHKLELEEARVKLIISSDMPLVCCNRTHLHEIMFHLLMNAAQHMGDCEDRRIEVSVSTHECEHQLEVRDHGQGIPEQELERIFEIFRSNSTSGRKRIVEGLGLAIVRRIAEAHGGRAWAENAADQGALFRVSLPFAE